MSTTTSSRASEAELLREALSFYANRDNHTIRRAGELHTAMKADLGMRARAALSAVPPQGQGQEGVSEDARILIVRLWALEENTQEADAQELAREAIRMIEALSHPTDTPKPGVSAEDLATLLNDIAVMSKWEKEARASGNAVKADFLRQAIAELTALSGLSTPPAAAPAGKDMIGDRPRTCRNRKRDAGLPYLRSGCEVCGTGGLTGCPYEKAAPAGKEAGR